MFSYIRQSNKQQNQPTYKDVLFEGWLFSQGKGILCIVCIGKERSM